MENNNNYIEELRIHYEKVWNNSGSILIWDKGPYEKLNFDFRVLEFPPTLEREMWTYATIGMSSHLVNTQDCLELHIFSYKQDRSIVELLTAISYYHKINAKLGLNHAINFGKSWQDDSDCTYGFISLPYLDGPDLENCQIGNYIVKCLWLIPITEKEFEFKKQRGSQALEDLFEENEFNYLNPNRKSLR